jgi:hypothetical protein
MRRAVVVVVVACIALTFLAGCSCSSDVDYQLLGGTNTSAADLGDAGGSALKAAEQQMKSVASDAVPVMIGSSGVSIAPPPEQWSVMFVSPSSNKLYSVPVSHKQAETARDMGSAAALPKANIDAAVDYSKLKIGSDEAYEKAKTELAKTGDVPPNVMQSITLIEMPGSPEAKTGVWEISFIKGTSTDGMRTAQVDAMTGAVTETTKK